MTSTIQPRPSSGGTNRGDLVAACQRAHRLWMSEPADQTNTIKLSQELFEVQVALERLELRTQRREINLDEEVQIAHVTARLMDLERRWTADGLAA